MIRALGYERCGAEIVVDVVLLMALKNGPWNIGVVVVILWLMLCYLWCDTGLGIKALWY